mmetsp:Transcript_24100/g.41271  ORF Transcript_24100/g.41271 Transcript_24100/m.41271 type:complete len:226 (+) Transcript_24100:163-840(+)
MTNNGCPFKPRRGYVDGRSDYLFHFYKVVDDDGNRDGDTNVPTRSPIASRNIEDPLYPWQIYSLIGTKPILQIVTDFYERVFDDTENDWFRGVFVDVAPLNHHIQTQAAYWVDAMGGGKYYHGGNYRLTFHHTHNAREIMNAKGAKQWMHHMKGALLAVKDKSVFANDPRILTCIVSFLEAKMRTYATDHGWEFDESDFIFLRNEFSRKAKDEDTNKGIEVTSEL